MKVTLIKSDKGIVGATSDDHEAYLRFKRRIVKMPIGTYIGLESKKIRNGQHHRKLFALVKLITENSENFETVAKALIAIKLVAGHFEPFIHPVTGELFDLPKSISYEEMEQDDFETFYKNAIDGVLQNILPQLDIETAEKLLDMIVAGWVS